MQILVLILDFYKWWYVQGLIKVFKYLKAYIILLADFFSLRILVSSFFQPWRKDIRSTRYLPLGLKLKIWLRNQIARLVGMFIKAPVLLGFLVCFFVLIVLEVLFILIWLIFPPLILLGGFYSIYLIFKF